MVRETDTKNRTEYFFDDIISIKNFDPNNIKRDKKNVKKYSHLLNRFYATKQSKTFFTYYK